MRLIHYSDAEIQALRSIPIEEMEERGGAYKPTGLWVSVEGEQDWPTWCAGEDWHLGVIATEIMLYPNTNVLTLRDADGIDKFTKAYSIVHFTVMDRTYHKIDWKSVAQNYHGLIIAPYCWDRRYTYHTSWYYGWDCASGCIWNMEAVSGFKIIDQSKNQLETSTA